MTAGVEAAMTSSFKENEAEALGLLLNRCAENICWLKGVMCFT